MSARGFCSYCKIEKDQITTVRGLGRSKTRQIPYDVFHFVPGQRGSTVSLQTKPSIPLLLHPFHHRN